MTEQFKPAPIMDLLDISLTLLSLGARAADQRTDLRSGRISVAKGWIMNALLRADMEGRDGLRLKDLAKETGLSVSTASESVDQLVLMGNISRKRDLADRRVVRIRITEAGKEAMAHCDAEIAGWWQKASEGMPQEQIDAFWTVTATAAERLRRACMAEDRKAYAADAAGRTEKAGKRAEAAAPSPLA